MNSVTLIGRLTADPELITRDEKQVGRLRIAIQRPKRDGENQGADFVDVTVFNRQAEVCAEYLAKGRRVAVSGRLQHSEWKAEDDSRRQKLEVIANQVDFLDSSQREAAEAEPEAEEVTA